MNGSSGISGAGVGLVKFNRAGTGRGGKFVGIVEGGTVGDKKHQAEPVAKTPEGVTANPAGTGTGGKFVGIVKGGTVEDKTHQAEPVAKTPEGVTAGVSPIYCFIGLQSWLLNWFFISNLSSLFNDVLVFVSFLDFGSGRRW